MHPFFQGKHTEPPDDSESEPARRPMSFAQLVSDMGDYEDLGNHDVALKFWLPEPAEKAIDELARMNGDSMSESLRQFFAIHCYGLYVFTVINQKTPGLFKDPGQPLFSRKRQDGPEAIPNGKRRETTYWVQELGKNVVPIKIWIPTRVKNDLQILADHVGIKLSQYLREIVISRLLGHGTLPKRPEMMFAVPLKAADDWCEDIHIPWMQVERDQYRIAYLRESREAWVDDFVQQ